MMSDKHRKIIQDKLISLGYQGKDIRSSSSDWLLSRLTVFMGPRQAGTYLKKLKRSNK